MAVTQKDIRYLGMLADIAGFQGNAAAARIIRGLLAEVENLRAVVQAFEDRMKAERALDEHVYADNGNGEYLGEKPCGCYCSPEGDHRYECDLARSVDEQRAEASSRIGIARVRLHKAEGANA